MELNEQKDMGIHTSIAAGYNSNNLNSSTPMFNHHHHQESLTNLLIENRVQQTLGQIHEPSNVADTDQDQDPISTGPTRSINIENAANNYRMIRYNACLKNHAAAMGGHVIDGCGEFMPSGEDGTPEALKCAACDCHRNFHRQEIDGQPPPPPHYYFPFNPHRRAHTRTHGLLRETSRKQNQYHYAHGGPTVPPPVMMSFGGNGSGVLAESSSGDLNMFNDNNVGGQVSKKRFRTKFSQQQKERMHELAEKVGWRIQKEDEEQVMQFCNEVGVKRKVFKVWMHNNKQSFKKINVGLK